MKGKRKSLSYKYGHGQKVWARVETPNNVKRQCKFCLGNVKFDIATPGGYLATITCPGCHGYDEWETVGAKVWAKPLTIGAVTISTVPHRIGVEYMCVETGVGSGTCWPEGVLFATEKEALLDKAEGKGTEPFEGWEDDAAK